MTDREKHLSLAIDALTMLNESMDESAGYGELTHVPYHYWRQLSGDAIASIEAAAIPKTGIIRRLVGRWERGGEAA